MSELRHLSPGASEKRKKRVAREAEKKAIETARYVIPVCAFTSMVHTVSGIVLHRLWRMMRTGDCPCESVAVVSAMVDHVRALDPDFFARVGAGPLAEGEVVEARLPAVAAGFDDEAARLDALLGARTSLLVDYTARGEETTAEAVRAVLGRTTATLPDDEALEQALNPSLNRYRLETLNLAVHSPLSRALHHATYTFLKKLSHTADSQDQRHRMVPGSRPLMILTDTRRPDFVTPPLVAKNAEARAVYEQAMDEAWAAKNRLLELGVPLEQALYVLPNAKALRFHETREPPVPRPQVGHAHLLQRAGGDLPREHGRARAGAGGAPAPGPPPGPALRAAGLPHHPHLHGGRALLRGARVAELPRGRATDLRAAGRLRGWGGVSVEAKERRSEDLLALTRDTVLSRGLGRSYGDSSLPPPSRPQAANTTLADRILSFDPNSGLLRAEAGLSVLELNRLFLPRRLLRARLPGHPVRDPGRDGGGRRARQEPPRGRMLRSARHLAAPARGRREDLGVRPGPGARCSFAPLWAGWASPATSSR